MIAPVTGAVQRPQREGEITIFACQAISLRSRVRDAHSSLINPVTFSFARTTKRLPSRFALTRQQEMTFRNNRSTSAANAE